MSKESVKLFFVAGLSLIVGGAAGGFVTRTVYGADRAVVDPSPNRAPVCPKCRECPVCPAVVDCGDRGLVPDDDSAYDDVLDETERINDGLPGLPASALGLASAAVKASIEPCTSMPGAGGNILLDLTVTATGGVGFIREAELKKAAPDVAIDRVDCVVSHARRARFEFTESEGQLEFQLPVRLD